MPQILDVKKVKKEPQKKPEELHEYRQEENQVEKKPMELTWQAPEYATYKKSADWYWALGIVTAGLLVVAYLMQNFLFGAVIAISVFSVLLYSARRPQIITFSITTQGVKVDDRLFPYDALKSFWVFYDPPYTKELSLLSQRMMVPYIKIPLRDTDPVKIREMLMQYIPEEPHSESLIDALARWLRF